MDQICAPVLMMLGRLPIQRFLLRCAAHPQLSQDPILIHFLLQEYGWRDAVNATKFYSKAESRRTLLGARFTLKNPDRRFDDLKNYSTELQSSIGNILKIRARMCESLYGVHKVHANYARVFKEWSLIDKDNAEHLQNASHYMDVYSSGIDSHLEETEHFADRLKEYNALGESLRAVCRQRDCAQYEVKRAEDYLVSKINQKEALPTAKAVGSESGKDISGFSLVGIKSKLFGSDTPEQKEAKLKFLGEQILHVESALSQLQKRCIFFTEDALRDIERFQEQKIEDVQEILVSYAQLQAQHCKQAIQTWNEIRDSFSHM